MTVRPSHLFDGMSFMGDPTPDLTLLVVCTGNICRSALAERWARSYLDELLGPSAQCIRITSAGTRALAGSAMHPYSAAVLEGLGGSADRFRARSLDEDLVAQADVILTMTRDHRSKVLEMDSRAFARTFTLLEAADLIQRLETTPDEPKDSVADCARSLVRGMAAARRGRRTGAEDDVPDPVGAGMDVHQHMGTTVVTAMRTVLDRILEVPRGLNP